MENNTFLDYMDSKFKDRFYLEQPVAYQTLANSLKRKQLAHAYLFHGPKGTPKKEAAFLLAKSLICKEADPFACENCQQCHRIDNGSYVDLIYLDGEGKSIKLENMHYIRDSFVKTGIESSNQKIYIINYAENATEEALNALLKFLEEPSGSTTTAILISEQVDRLLPTIRSRCQSIQFKPLVSQSCYEYCNEAGYNLLDSYLLSQLYRDLNQIHVMKEKEEYQTAKEMFMNFIIQLEDNESMAFVDLEKIFLSVKKDKSKETLRCFMELCSLFFMDLFRESFVEDEWYIEQSERMRKSKYHKVSVIQLFLEAQNKLLPSSTFNQILIIEQLFYQLKEVTKNG